MLKQYLGDEAFDRLVTDFVNSAHSEHFNVGRYAAQLPNFSQRSIMQMTHSHMSLAVLENAVSQLHDPEETIPLEPAHLIGMTAESLMETVLTHACRIGQLFAFDYPVNDYYTAAKEEKLPTPPMPTKIFSCRVSVTKMWSGAWN